ncbi:MAG: hypothetical protein A4E55_00632 [Pelotomaculum sp. PtaU1.Bin035]|nr:MAG: hypothetical protein A4E55_00632 [Pelotomaculum sp. PtaU1.Bin035]
MERFVAVITLTVVIHLISTLAYSVRLAGVRTRRLLTAFSLYNIIYLMASFSNNIQAPLLTSIVEHGINAGAMQAGVGVPVEQLVFHEAYKGQLALLAEQIRLVMVAATVGTAAGALLIPPFISIFVKAIQLFERTGSAIRAFSSIIFYCPPWRLRPCRFRFSACWPMIRQITKQRIKIPKKLLLANIFVSGFYLTGVLSALYAGAMFPDFRTTATTLSMVINGFATVLGAMVVEPAASSITDEAFRGDRDESDVRQLAFYLALTRLLGTVFAQALFLPGAYIIKLIVQMLD